MSWGKDQTLFMTLAGQTTESWNLDQAARYLKHIDEEADEIKRATADQDFVKLVDGLVDVCVVAIGAIRSLGIDPDEAWLAVMQANMTKVDGSLGETVYRPDGQIGKPEGWKGPEDKLEVLLWAAQVRADKT